MPRRRNHGAATVFLPAFVPHKPLTKLEKEIQSKILNSPSEPTEAEIKHYKKRLTAQCPTIPGLPTQDQDIFKHNYKIDVVDFLIATLEKRQTLHTAALGYFF